MKFKKERTIKAFQRIVTDLSQNEICWYGTFHDATVKLMKDEDDDQSISSVWVYFDVPNELTHKYVQPLVGVFMIAVLPEDAQLGNYVERCIEAARTGGGIDEQIGHVHIHQGSVSGRVELTAHFFV